MKDREIKFRAWDKSMKKFHYPKLWDNSMPSNWEHWYVLQQYAGVKDRKGKEIHEGDVLEFADKWEWYKGSYAIKMHFADAERLKELQAQYDNEPMERRTVELPQDYEWLLSSEIQTYWEVIGNIFENPELIIQTKTNER